MPNQFTATPVSIRRLRHGEARRGKRTPEHQTWSSIKGRCQNPQNRLYAYYGGRGISVCDAWQDYETFLRDVGRRPSPEYSLDRIDNSKGYEPSNVRWATRTEQQRNKRDNNWLTAGGETMLAIEWSERTGIPLVNIRVRLTRLGWTPEQAVGIAPREPQARPSLTVGEVTRTHVEWAALAGITVDAIRWRLREGWPPEAVIGQSQRPREKPSLRQPLEQLEYPE